jgi:hypothetical protein
MVGRFFNLIKKNLGGIELNYDPIHFENEPHWLQTLSLKCTHIDSVFSMYCLTQTKVNSEGTHLYNLLTKILL